MSNFSHPFGISGDEVTQNFTSANFVISGSEGVVDNGILEFSSPASSYNGLVSSTTGTIYLQRTATTAVASIGATDSCYEDRGSVGGKGIWCMPSSTNISPNPFDFRSSAGWTNSNVGIVPNAAVGPEGTIQGQKVTDATTVQTATVSVGAITLASYTSSIWFYDDPANLPTARPVMLRQIFAGSDFPATTGAWQRYSSRQDSQNNAGFCAASVNTLPPVGGIYAWGHQTVAGNFDLPLINGAGAVLQSLDASHSQAIVRGGNLDFEMSFYQSSTDWQTYETGFYLWSATTADGLMAVRYDGINWILTVRGVDVLGNTNPGGTAGGGNGAKICTVPGTYMTVRAWYNISTGACGLRVGVNNTDMIDSVGSTTGSALIAPTQVYLGTNLGSGTLAFKGQVLYVRRPTENAPSLKLAEFVFAGDSIMGYFNTAAVAARFYTYAEARARAGIINQAVSGYVISNASSIWSSSPWKSLSTTKAIYIQVGLNNINTGFTSAATIAELQTFVNLIRTDNPAIKIVIGQLLPCKFFLVNTFGAAYYTKWQEINAAIAGNGATPITGVDGRVLGGDVGSPLNDGADNLTAIYDDGSHYHTNTAGKLANAGIVRPVFHSLGLI